MHYRINAYKEPKKVWKMPENIKDRIDAFGLLNFVLSILCFAIAGTAHGIAIVNDKIPHTDPLLTQMFLPPSIVMICIASLILATRLSWHFIKVIKGDETLT